MTSPFFIQEDVCAEFEDFKSFGFTGKCKNIVHDSYPCMSLLQYNLQMCQCSLCVMSFCSMFSKKQEVSIAHPEPSGLSLG